MTFRRLLSFFALGLGLVGSLACLAAILALWSVGARLRHTTEAVFGKFDGSLVVVQKQAERAQDLLKASQITTESIANSLKQWTKLEAGQRLALRLDLVEKSDRQRVVMQQADKWLEVSATSAELVQQALSMGNAMGAQMDTAFVDGLIEEIASLQSQLADATEFVEKFHERVAAMGDEESRQERIEQAVRLALPVIATLSSLDSRFDKFGNRLAEARLNLQGLKINTLQWVRVLTVAVLLLTIWTTAGQVALCCIAWNGLRSTQHSTG